MPMPESWTIKDLLRVSTDYLEEKQIDSPRLTAEVLLAFQLEMSRISLYLNLDQPLNESEVSGYRELIRRRIQREPLQYITGVQEFWSLDFEVDPRVLIPRPETELLVEQAMAIHETLSTQNATIDRILDLGTGSGALAITLAKEIPDARIWATDISGGAINLAARNAEKHEVSDRIEFIQGDLWQPLMDQGIAFDLVVSNPPYVSDEEYQDLSPEVHDYEPRISLCGHENGLYYVQEIIKGCKDVLSPGGWLLMEMSPGQTEKALELIRSVETLEKGTRIRDYSHRYRVVATQKRGLH